MDETTDSLRCAILGTGMMGCEHVSYLMGYARKASVEFLCDPNTKSLQACETVMKEFQKSSIATNDQKNEKTARELTTENPIGPKLLESEAELLEYVHEIDLLVIASPNYLHTEQLLRWGKYEHLTILCEKPVAVSQEQVDQLREYFSKKTMVPRANIWVAMEYRFIPAIAKLLSLVPSVVGDIRMVTIRENRYPFLHKVGAWNRDRSKTGDTLVEKCCHFFDLFRLITGQEADLDKVRALAQRGINYGTEALEYETPIIDSAYVITPFHDQREHGNSEKTETIGCLELCMYAEGSRHQEEIIVTGTKGRLEAYLPENKVYAFERPDHAKWKDRSVPPPPESIKRCIYDCSDVRAVHGITEDEALPTHSGYHYSSTAVEWYQLFQSIHAFRETGEWRPMVSLEDGLRAVEIGLQATQAIVNT